VGNSREDIKVKIMRTDRDCESPEDFKNKVEKNFDLCGRVEIWFYSNKFDETNIFLINIYLIIIFLFLVRIDAHFTT
jgi:hypothetical protein